MVKSALVVWMLGRLLSRSLISSRSFSTSKMTSNAAKWFPPAPTTPKPTLKVYNSLTRQKEEFIPAAGNLVKWYNCGPTVYDASHMGHARNYVTQDILRRIMEDYFGYDVHLVMNITDIDDKIILRARHQYLIDDLKKRNPLLNQELIDMTQDSWEKYLKGKVLKSIPSAELEAQSSHLAAQWQYVQARVLDPSWLQEALQRDEKFSMHITTLETSFSALEVARMQMNAGSSSETAAATLIDKSKDTLALVLDEELKHTVSDPAIFRSTAAFWEDSFMADMARLRVKPPTTLTRVTEYVPEIVTFIEKIIANGFAYSGEDGNVWFDKAAFDGAPTQEWKHEYAKLAPWSRGNKALLAEGEGALTSYSSKRSPEDFALWKASKAGEPAWPSPWGQGRPGWHIECSVMATDILGESMDIHSGGIDLLFPHHDNELAQSEAYHNNVQWVNYFLHTGHLHIAGLKMSKSLKNFITIEEMLETWTPRQVRLSFLLQLWNSRLDWNESLQTEVKARETALDNFFVQTKALVSEWDAAPTPQNGTWKYGKDEKDLAAELYRAQHTFRTALCDSFNTPQAVQALNDLVSYTNVYLKRGRSATNISSIRQVAGWITKMLRMFGLGEGSPQEIGWGASTSASGGEDVSADKETVLMPYLRALSTFRDEVRKKAMAKDPHSEFLELTDRLRDEDLVPLGVALDDQEDGKALVKLMPPSVLIKARDDKKALLAAKAAQKAAQKAAAAQQQLAKLEKGKLSPEEMFKPPNVPEGTYSEWDAKGIPVLDGKGEELSKGQSKKLAKAWEEQAKRHDAWLAHLSQREGQSKE